MAGDGSRALDIEAEAIVQACKELEKHLRNAGLHGRADALSLILADGKPSVEGLRACRYVLGLTLNHNPPLADALQLKVVDIMLVIDRRLKNHRTGREKPRRNGGQ